MSGIKLNPVMQDVTLDANGQQRIVTIEFQNNEPQSRLVTFSIRDFATTGKDGQIQFLQPGEGAFRLTPFAKLATPEQVLVEPGVSYTIKVAITADPKLPPTGYYGAVVAQIADPLATGTLGVQPAVSSLLLVRLTGKGEEKLALKGIESNDSLFRLPTQATLSIQNPGEIHTAPRGRVLLLSPRQTIIARGTVNEDSSYVLPGVERFYGTKLKTVDSEPWYQQIGIYELVTEYRADGTARPSVDREDVLYINPWLMVAALATTTLLLLLARWTVYRFRLTERVSKFFKKG